MNTMCNLITMHFVFLQMPRVYKRKSQRQTWTESQMAEAKRAVDCGVSVRAAAKMHQIPRITLARWIKLAVVKKSLGSKKVVFTQSQETELVQHLLDLESRFYGVTIRDVQKLAYELAEKNSLPHPFNHERKIAGRNWLDAFLKRNPKLSFRKPEATSAARARGFNKPSVNAFFDLLENTLHKKRFQPSRIFNADETGISTVNELFGDFVQT